MDTTPSPALTPASTLTPGTTPAPPPYEPPTILFQGVLETRAGSPTIIPYDFLNPGDPLREP